MNALEIKPKIYWVGAIDWELRDFHGYLTQRGSTYNAYLILDEKIVLVDTVKEHFFEEMHSRIKTVVDPSKIDYVVSNHVEMDHSGSISKILEFAPNAKVITSPNGKKGLLAHFKKDWDFQVVNSGDSTRIGQRTLKFVLTPMVHWPDSMATYIPEEKLLLPNDAFGQHIATAERFDDEIGLEIVMEEAAKYYANIVFPYGSQVGKALESLSTFDIQLIGPSHGLIWRTHIPKIVEAYKKWAGNESNPQALIVYDTMWGSTKKLANSLWEGLESVGVKVEIRNLKTNHISAIMADVLDSKAILIGSPTLNNGMLPTVGAFLTYLRGLRPKNRIGFAFGSYGWGGQAVGEIEKVMAELNWELPLSSLNLQWVPDAQGFELARERGSQLGRIIKEG